MLHSINDSSDMFSISFESFNSFVVKHLQDIKTGRIIITFDDGFESVYRFAFPLLRDLGIRFKIFIVPTFIDKPQYLTKSQIVEMIDSGFVEIGSHGLTHKVLDRTISEAEAAKEISRSKIVLEDLFHVKVDEFAFSHGIIYKRFLFLVKKNYRKAFIATNGIRDLLFCSKYKTPRVNLCDRTIEEVEKLI